MQPAEIIAALSNEELDFASIARVANAKHLPHLGVDEVLDTDVALVINGELRHRRIEALIGSALGRAPKSIWPQWYADDGVQEIHADSLLPAHSFSQQQSASGFGSEAASNPPGSLEARVMALRARSQEIRIRSLIVQTHTPRKSLLGAIDDLQRLQLDLESFDGEFQSTDELVDQLIRIRGTLAGIVRHVP